MIALIAALALAQGEPAATSGPEMDPLSGAPSGTTRSEALVGRLHIPDGMGPAILPYLGCLFASRTDFRPVPGAIDPRPAGIGPGDDCNAYREQAARQADRLLRNRYRGSRNERRALIEQVLADADNFITDTPGPPSRPGDKPDAEDR